MLISTWIQIVLSQPPDVQICGDGNPARNHPPVRSWSKNNQSSDMIFIFIILLLCTSKMIDDNVIWKTAPFMCYLMLIWINMNYYSSFPQGPRSQLAPTPALWLVVIVAIALHEPYIPSQRLQNTNLLYLSSWIPQRHSMSVLRYFVRWLCIIFAFISWESFSSLFFLLLLLQKSWIFLSSRVSEANLICKLNFFITIGQLLTYQ